MRTIVILLLFILNLVAQERLISLSPSITEIVYALQKGDKLVATSSYSLYPEEAKQLPIVGSYTNPNIEKILSKNLNINFLTSVKIIKAKETKQKIILIDDKENTYSFDMLLVSVGVEPNSAGLGLEKVGISLNSGFVKFGI